MEYVLRVIKERNIPTSLDRKTNYRKHNPHEFRRRIFSWELQLLCLGNITFTLQKTVMERQLLFVFLVGSAMNWCHPAFDQ